MQHICFPNHEYNTMYPSLLFFVQRVEELLHYGTLDTYKFSALNARNLARDYCAVYYDIEEGKISDKNDEPVLEELIWSLKKDEAAISVLGKHYVDYFTKSVYSLPKKERFDNCNYIYRKLKEKTYYEEIVKLLDVAIRETCNLEAINQYANCWVKELINRRYDKNYIYAQLHTYFLVRRHIDENSFRSFAAKFDFIEKEYKVYLIVHKNFSNVSSLYNEASIKISIVNSSDYPSGLKLKDEKNELLILCEKIMALDEYSAYDNAKNITNLLINFDMFYSHRKGSDNYYGRVICPDGRTKIIRNKRNSINKGLLEITESSDAVQLFNISRVSFENLYKMSRLTEIHNAALQSTNLENALLDFWSILELLQEKVKDSHARIKQIINLSTPFLRNNYVLKLIKNLSDSIFKWDKEFFANNIETIPYGSTSIEKTFAFVTFDEYEDNRKALSNISTDYPLLTYRIHALNKQLGLTSNIHKMLETHTQRVTWHFYRIYRARNLIVHDGEPVENMQLLVNNLHSYVDIICNGITSTMVEYPHIDSIDEAILEEQIQASVFKSNMQQPGQKIDKDNFLAYLYSRIK